MRKWIGALFKQLPPSQSCSTWPAIFPRHMATTALGSSTPPTNAETETSLSTTVATTMEAVVRSSYSTVRENCPGNVGRPVSASGFGGEGNRVDFYFAPDGTIKWWIYNCVGCKRVDTTYERCRGASSIQVLGERISQGTLNRVIKLPHPGYRQIFWYCGANRERTAWGSGANELSVSYFYDGKIEFVVKYCYR